MTLNKKKKREETPEKDFVFGKHVVLESLKNARVNKLFLQEDAKGVFVEELKTLAKTMSVPIKWVTKEKLIEMSDGGNHQGVLAAISPYTYLSLQELLEQTQSEEAFYIVLDSVEDPHNFGSIIRTSEAAKVNGIIIPKHRAVGITPTVVKTSTGAVEHLPIARVTNLNAAIQTLKDEGFWIFGTDMNGTDYRKWNTKGKIVLIIGNEGRGISNGLKKEVDEMLAIPMNGQVQSLNASVAAGILIYEVFRNKN